MTIAHFINTPSHGTHSPSEPWLICDCGDGYVLKVFGLPQSIQGVIDLQGVEVVRFVAKQDISEEEYAESLAEAEAYLGWLYCAHKSATLN